MLVVLGGCTVPEATRVEVAEGPLLIAIDGASQGPPGSDFVPRRRVALRMPDGSTRAIDREAIAFAPAWRGGAALVDVERRLYEVGASGALRMLAASVNGELAVSGELLVYVVGSGLTGELRVHDGHVERTIASALASIGALRVVEGRVLFVGAVSGGVAGVWQAPLDGSGARCLTSCELRTGTDWGQRHVPLPASRESFELDGDRVVWIDAVGVRHQAVLH